MASIRENKRDEMIIDAILAEHKHLAEMRSNALRFALNFWWDHRPARAEAQERERGTEEEEESDVL